MQKKLKEQNLASLKEEMHDIQKSLDQYSDSKKIFEAKSEKDIDDPAGKLLFKNVIDILFFIIFFVIQ